MYDQKDIVLIPFPYSDLSGSKQRPALIISNSLLNKTQDRICCLITTNEHKDDIAITRNSFQDGKLPFKSFIRPHRLFTINEMIIKKRICSINNSLHNKIISRINDYLKSELSNY